VAQIVNFFVVDPVSGMKKFGSGINRNAPKFGPFSTLAPFFGVDEFVFIVLKLLIYA
jgi:hypothetical protein